MIAKNVNKDWAMGISFAQFCKDANISKLSIAEQKKLYEEVTGKKVKTKKQGD